MINYISHKKSKQIVNGLPKLPTSDQLKEGEIAINYANGYETLSIKNSENEIITFSSTEQFEKYVDTTLGNKLGSGFTGENSANTVTSIIEENEKIASASLNDLNERKLDASAYTPTDLSDYYKKEETSGKTELGTAFGLKANASDLTAHTGNSTVHITSAERTKWNNAATTLASHSGNATVHITSAERTKWNGKLSNVQYNKTDKKIYFYSGATSETPVSSVDATDFIKDGMVSNVEIKNVTNSGSCLVITFNADAGKQDIVIPVSKIFNPANYYLKSETSGKTEIATALNSKANTSDLSNYYKKSETSGSTQLTTALNLKANASDLTAHTGDKTAHITADERTKWNNAAASSHTHANKAVLDKITAIDAKLSETSNNLVVNSAITKVIVANEKISSAALNELNERKLDASAYTPTDLSDYYKKEETSGKTELDAALKLKANSTDLATKANRTDLTAHTGNSTIHITSDERTKWNNAATTLASHSGNTTVHITSAERTKWNGKISSAQYSSADKKINFYSGATTETPVSSIDATDFIKDGMVSNVEIKNVTSSGTCLVITFNADAGKQNITIPISKIFNSANYYLKNETSGKTELDTALALKANASDLATKANTSDLTAHISDNIKHITSDERTKWDGAATTLVSHTGNSTVHITAKERTKWNNAATSSHTHANKAVLDTITAIDTELSETSNNLVVNSAITKVIIANEKISSSALNDLNDRKLDASAYTPTDLSDYYKKEETSGKTDLNTAFGLKANATDLTAHISDNIKHITSDERTKWNNATTTLATHTGDSTVHITAEERTKWNGKISNARYNSKDKKIYFYSGATTEKPVANIDATDFIKDGMVSNVEIKDVANSGSCLVITFNTDANKQAINIPISTIFNPANYYKKSETSGSTELNTAFGLKANVSDFTAHTRNNGIHITADERTKWNNAIHTHANKAILDTITTIDSELNENSKNLVVNSAITTVILENEKIVSTSLNDLNDRKLDASAYTPTDLSDYYKKEETSGKTELTTAFNSKANSTDLATKANQSDLTAHTGNSTVHITSTERTKWNNAATNSHTHANKDVLDKITAIDTELSKTSNNLVVSSAITKVLIDNEKVVSAALNDLNDRKLDINYTGFTGTTLSGVTSIIQAIQKIADKLDGTATNS